MNSRARLTFPFFVGAWRSGTTLVRAMFDSHPVIAIPPESHFIPALAPASRQMHRADFNLDGFVTHLTSDRMFAHWGLPAESVAAALRHGAVSTYPDAVRGLFALYARRHDKQRYADKTPEYVLAMPALAAMFEEARFVHIIRDGRDVALSIVQQPFGPDTVGRAIAIWRERVRRGRHDGRRLGPDRYRELRYEDLITDPEAALRPVCAFLGIEFDGAMLRYYQRAETLVTRNPRSHRHLLEPPKSGIRDWRRQMSSPDQAMCDAVAGRLLEALGYERAATSRPLVMRYRSVRVLGAVKTRGAVRHLARRVGIRTAAPAGAGSRRRDQAPAPAAPSDPVAETPVEAAATDSLPPPGI